nr:L,D-transpeptidase [Methylobacterium sp. ap11]
MPALPLPDAPIRLVSLAPEAPSVQAAAGPVVAIPAAPGPAAVRTAALPVEPPAPAPRLVPPAAPAPVAPVALPAVRRGRVIGFPGAQAPGTIVVDTAARFLYLVRGDGTAIRYRVAVGRPGTTWKGVETVTAKQEWPQWTPTPEMRRSRPGLPRHVVGGPHNPLGARALYLGSTLYRIHGTTNPRSIGRAASAGCFRMLNEDVIELYRFVPVGTKVQVI